MTEDELRAIEARANAAMPGPWEGFDNNPCDDYWAKDYPADAEFIARAREDIPRLVAEVRKLRRWLAPSHEGACPILTTFVECELCVSPATEYVCDMVEGEPQNGHETWAIDSQHYFCEEHKREPILRRHCDGG